MWMILFFISLSVNIVGFLYVKWLLKSYKILWEDLGNISIMLADFSKHASNLHELELYYGDDDIRSLIKHGNDLLEKIGEVDFIFEPEESEEESIAIEEGGALS